MIARTNICEYLTSVVLNLGSAPPPLKGVPKTTRGPQGFVSSNDTVHISVCEVTIILVATVVQTGQTSSKLQRLKAKNNDTVTCA